MSINLKQIRDIPYADQNATCSLEDAELMTKLRYASQTTGLRALARELGVSPYWLGKKATQLGVDGRRQIRLGLPEDRELRLKIRNCFTMNQLADELGVPVHVIWDQAKRLKIRRGLFVRPNLNSRLPTDNCNASVADLEQYRHRIAELEEIFALASDNLTEKERENFLLSQNNLRSEAEIADLRRRLAFFQERARPAIKRDTAPQSVDQLMDFIQTGLGDCLVVLPRAIKATRKVKNFNVEKLYTALLLLRDAYQPMRSGLISPEDCEIQMREALFEEGPSLANSNKLASLGYQVEWNGRTILLDRHIKWGRDVKWLIRVYFHYCSASKTVVVGWMPTHLDTDATN